MEISYSEERLCADEYMDFLKRTDLGSQYPKERFRERIEKLVAKVPVSLTARDACGKVIGVLFGLTDYSYWLFITDLGVDRAFAKRGIGTALMKKALEVAGGEENIAVYLVANDKAMPFYEKLGMKQSSDVMEYNRVDWTPFTFE